ncbi:MAG: flagellar motor switch protein FliN [bacterium]|nr:flagellar motor switch protein FliN [bacterium]
MADDNALSPEEVDALFGKGESEAGGTTEGGVLSANQMKILSSVYSKAFMSAATVLGTILKKNVTIANAKINTINKTEFLKNVPSPGILAKVSYSGALSDNDYIIFAQKDEAIIADLMMGGDGSSPPDEINELYLGAIVEATTQVMSSVANSLSTSAGGNITVSASDVNIVDFTQEEVDIPVLNNPTFTFISYDLVVKGLVKGTIKQIPPTRLIQLIETSKNKGAMTASAQAASPDRFTTPPTLNRGGSVNPVQFGSLGAGTSSQLPGNIGLLMDVPMRITVELGRTEMTIKDILALGEGSIVELNKLAGEPVELLVNGKSIAKGGVVVIDENFGIRITEISSPSERLSKIR